MKKDEQTLWVRRYPTDGLRALYRLTDVSGFRWDEVSGGLNRHTPQQFIFANVWCDGMIEGDIAHSGSHGPCPHRIRVCVVQRDNPRSVMEELFAIVGPRPAAAADRDIQQMLEALGENPDGLTRVELSRLVGPLVSTNSQRFARRIQRLRSLPEVTESRERRPAADGAMRLQSVFRLNRTT